MLIEIIVSIVSIVVLVVLVVLPPNPPCPCNTEVGSNPSPNTVRAHAARSLYPSSWVVLPLPPFSLLPFSLLPLPLPLLLPLLPLLLPVMPLLLPLMPLLLPLLLPLLPLLPTRDHGDHGGGHAFNTTARNKCRRPQCVASVCTGGRWPKRHNNNVYQEWVRGSVAYKGAKRRKHDNQLDTPLGKSLDTPVDTPLGTPVGTPVPWWPWWCRWCRCEVLEETCNKPSLAK